MIVCPRTSGYSQGQTRAGVPVRLDQQDSSGQWSTISAAQTDQDGRCAQLVTDRLDTRGRRVSIDFDTASYFAAKQQEGCTRRSRSPFGFS